jgi:hypothetical protein
LPKANGQQLKAFLKNIPLTPFKRGNGASIQKQETSNQQPNSKFEIPKDKGEKPKID